MTLRRYGFNQKNWCPSAKIDIYKLFVRSQMEYGMQVNIYKKCEIQMFEKTQQLSLRIAYGVPWNTSKTALKRLSCLESMECRNLLLNARFIRPLLLGTFATIPASRLFNSVLKQKGSLAHKWNLCNHYLEQLKRVNEKSMKTTIKPVLSVVDLAIALEIMLLSAQREVDSFVATTEFVTIWPLNGAKLVSQLTLSLVIFSLTTSASQVISECFLSLPTKIFLLTSQSSLP